MPASKKRVYTRYVVAAVRLLGAMTQAERKRRRMSAQELADRLGVGRETVRRLEAGDPKVEVGLAFEACAMMGIELFGADKPALSARLDDVGQRLALLPRYARPRSLEIDDDF